MHQGPVAGQVAHCPVEVQVGFDSIVEIVRTGTRHPFEGVAQLRDGLCAISVTR